MILHKVAHIFIALSIVGMVACVSTSSKKARIVVMIDGSKAVNKTVMRAIDGRYDLVSSRKYKRVARKLRAKSKRSQDIRKVAKKLDLNAYVIGRWVKRGKKKYILKLGFHEGRTGSEVETVQLRFSSKKLKRRDKKKIRTKIYAALSEVDDWGPKSAMERKRERRKKRAKKEKRRAQIARRERKEREEEEEFLEEEEERSEKKKRKKKKKKHKKKSKKTRYKVVTEIDSTGQAIDDESPF